MNKTESRRVMWMMLYVEWIMPSGVMTKLLKVAVSLGVDGLIELCSWIVNEGIFEEYCIFTNV